MYKPVFLGLIPVESSHVGPALYPKKHLQSAKYKTDCARQDLPTDFEVVSGGPTADLLAVNICLEDNEGLK